MLQVSTRVRRALPLLLRERPLCASLESAPERTDRARATRTLHRGHGVPALLELVLRVSLALKDR